MAGENELSLESIVSDVEASEADPSPVQNEGQDDFPDIDVGEHDAPDLEQQADPIQAAQDPAAEVDDPEDPYDEWDAGGKHYKMKKSELRAGHMRDADYRQKTAKAAEEVRQAQGASQQYQAKLQETANRFDVVLQSMYQDIIGGQPDPKLIDTEPQEYLRQQALHTQRVQKFQLAQQERQAVMQQMTAEQTQRQAQQMQQTVAAEGEKLLRAIPEWRDQKVLELERGQILETLTAHGWTPQELENFNDSRAVVLARKAAKWDQLQKVRQSKVAAPQPAAPKAIRPGASGSNNMANQVVQRATERLRRNNSDLDALTGFLGTQGI